MAPRSTNSTSGGAQGASRAAAKRPPKGATTGRGGSGGDHARTLPAAAHSPPPQGTADGTFVLINFLEKYESDPVLFATEVLGATPRRWQREFLGHVAAGKRRISIKAGHGVGKAGSNSEPVLTPAGWVTFGDIKVGDKVATVDGTFTEVTNVWPQGERDLYRVTLDDGCSVIVDGDHLWETTTRSERKHGKSGKVRTTREIAETLTFPNGERRGLNHCLPRMAAIQHSEAVLPLDPYLLGCWLGDGNGNSIYGPAAKREQQMAAAGAAGVVAFEHADQAEKAGYVSLYGVRPALRAMGLLECRSWEKFVPQGYLVASIAQRTALLQGLLDTDGTAGAENNAITFDTSSERLADNLSELVRSLGGVARRSGRQGKLNGVEKRWSYRVFISLPPEIAPFRNAAKANRYQPDHDHKNRTRVLSRFIASIEPEGRGEATCIAVAHPSKLFITKDHIVTHNSTAVAWVLIWSILCRAPQKSVCTAPTAPQLFDALFAELKSWVNRLPPVLRDLLEVYSDRIELKGDPDGSFISARTSSADRPESLAGIHSEHVLLIADEASGIPEPVFESATGSMSGHSATTILIGNPTRLTGLFYNSHTRLADRWERMTVSCLDPDLADLVDKDFVQQVAETWGEDSPQYSIRVLGEFPKTEENNLISPELVDAAMKRDVVLDTNQPLVFGVDVARFGGDRSVICKRQGNVVIEIISRTGNDLMETTGWVISEARKDNPSEILVDSIGVGAGVADRLRELKYNVRDVNVAESAALNPQAARLRDELWLTCRDWLQQRACKLPKMDELRVELSAPLYKFNSNGTYKIEAKDEMRKRIRRSPDLADALCLTFAGDAAIVGGRAMKWVSGQPLKRGLRGIV